MSAPRKTVAPEVLLKAYDDYQGNKTAMAVALGMDRTTIRRMLSELGVTKPVSGGYIAPPKPNKMPLPARGVVYRYILTCAQNNTRIHPKLLENFKAYQKHFGAKRCHIMVSRLKYNKAAWHNAILAKAGREPKDGIEAVWYDPAIREYVCDDPERHGGCRYELAPTLHWCAETNISPTAVNPFSGFQNHAGERSAIFPHTKQEMNSRPRMPSEEPLFVYTTGTLTKMNYIQRKEGQKAEFHHVYGALLVEVDHRGDWWARQLNADSSGSFYDCPNGNVVLVKNGKVTKGQRPLAINWGDVHASEIDPEVRRINWGSPRGYRDGAIDKLRPRYQFMHDLFSCRAQNHHDRSFSVRYEKWWLKQDIMKKEVDETRDLVNYSSRPWCKTIVVASNHHEHGDRWLNDANFKEDLPNAKIFLQAQLARVAAIEAGDSSWSFLRWALEREGGGTAVRYLGADDTFKLGPKNRRLEFAMHGHLGPNGARGTLRNIVIVGSGKSNKGHDHTAAILQGTASSGTCQLRFGYMKGPSSHSVSHILTYGNAKRCMLTQRAGALWANGC